MPDVIKKYWSVDDDHTLKKDIQFFFDQLESEKKTASLSDIAGRFVFIMLKLCKHETSHDWNHEMNSYFVNQLSQISNKDLCIDIVK